MAKNARKIELSEHGGEPARTWPEDSLAVTPSAKRAHPLCELPRDPAGAIADRPPAAFGLRKFMKSVNYFTFCWVGMS
jgi:hypothetical protein